MKLRKGQYKIKLKDGIGQLLHAFIDDRRFCGSYIALCYIKEPEMMQMHEQAQSKNNGQIVLGIPAYISIIDHGRSLIVFPACDKAKELTIEYYPQARRA